MTHAGEDKHDTCRQTTKQKGPFTPLPHDEASHSDNCSGHHHSVNVEETSGTRLLITLALNLIIPVIQIIAGVFAHSMALISDATHNFSDFMAILISYIAYRIGKKGATAQNTFGYRRAEIMAALLNVTLLSGACIFILYGAFQRFSAPEIVSGKIVIWMMFKPWYWLDPLLSILIAAFILKNCWTILKSSTSILMNAVPSDLDLNDVRSHLLSMDGIQNVHYLHAWPLSSSGVSFSCHVVVPDQLVSRTEKLSEQIRNSIFHTFGIDHPVLQFETESCGNGTLLCEMFTGKIKSIEQRMKNESRRI